MQKNRQMNNLMKKLQFALLLIFFAGLIGQPAAVSAANVVGYVASKESLKSFFESTLSPTGKAVIVSKVAARKQISGRFDRSDPELFLDNLSRQMGLIWYTDGKAYYIYDASEIRNALITLHNMRLDEFNRFLKQTGLYNERYTITGGGNNTFYVSGPPVYVELIINAAKLMVNNSEGIELGGQMIGIIHLVNTFVTDRSYELRGDKITIPGVAKIVAMLLNDSARRTVITDITSDYVAEDVPKMPPLNLTAEEKEVKVEKRTDDYISSFATSDDIRIVAYPDSNNILVRGTAAQVEFVKKLVASLDVPKRHIELSLWIIDIDKNDLEGLGADWSGSMNLGSTVSLAFNQPGSVSTLDGKRFIANIQALEEKERASVISRPIILTQENIPAIFDNNRTFYTKIIGERTSSLEKVTYGTMISVLPRFGGGNQIELVLNIEDGSEDDSGVSTVDGMPKVGRTAISTVARVPQGKSLLVGGYTKNANAVHKRKIPFLGSLPFVGKLFSMESNTDAEVVRVFLIQPREIREDSMLSASDVERDTQTIIEKMRTEKEIPQDFMRKWVNVYLNRNIRGTDYGN